MIRALVLLALLAGCAGPVAAPRTVYVRQKIPLALLTPPASPVVPAARDQASAARFIVDQWQALGACQAQILAIGKVVTP